MTKHRRKRKTKSKPWRIGKHLAAKRRWGAKYKPKFAGGRGKRLETAAGHDFLNSTRWQEVRKHVLASAPLCEECRTVGRLAPATCVDHVIPRRQLTVEQAYDTANLRALCEPCHNRKSAGEGNQLRREVKKAKAETALDWCGMPPPG